MFAKEQDSFPKVETEWSIIAWEHRYGRREVMQKVSRPFRPKTFWACSHMPDNACVINLHHYKNWTKETDVLILFAAFSSYFIPFS